MNSSQLKILIGIGIFLAFDLFSILTYRVIKTNLTKASEDNKELIGSFNVVLNGDSLIKLAEKIKPKKEQAQKSPQIAVTEPKDELSKEDLSIIILNGNGVEGNASFAAELILGQGYKIAEVSNADKPTYEQTNIFFHQDSEFLIKDLQSVLETYYNEIVAIPLGKERTRVEIILGSPKN